MENLIGEIVINIKLGEGKVTDLSKGYVSIDFDGIIKKFQFPDAFGKGMFLKAKNAIIQSKLERMAENEKEKKEFETAKAQEAQREKEEAERREKRKKELELKATIRHDYTIWIKFEGPQNPNGCANLHKVKLGDKYICILNYTKSKRPTAVKDGDVFFMAEGIVDEKGINQQVITGRGHLCGFNPNTNESLEEWYKEYSWMEQRPWYVEIKDFEQLDTQIKNCPTLDDILSVCGSDTYEASYGKDKTHEELRKMHTQKIHMKLTPIAEDYINKVFDKYVEKYGSTRYFSKDESIDK